MSTKNRPTPERILKQLTQVIGVCQAHDDFNAGPEVTLQKLKDHRDRLAASVTDIDELRRQITEKADQRDDYARTANELVMRARKGILAFFGPDSTQYSQAGGVRSSERKRPSRSSPPTTLPKAA